MHAGEWCYYWTSTKDTDYNSMTFIIMATASNVAWGSLNTDYSLIPIRPVSKEGKEVPPTTYTLTIKATGNGAAVYDGTTIRSKSSTFTINEGSSATITFTPDAGYRIKSVKVNGSNVTSSVSNNRYTVSNISKDISVEVEFEAIPPTTYTLSITSTGSGTAAYAGSTIRGKTRTFTVNEGSSAVITFTPDAGYKIKSVKVNSTDVTSRVSNNRYTINNIRSNTILEVEFETALPTTYSLTIKATGNGSASYIGTTVRSNTRTFNFVEGSSAKIVFTPDAGYRIKIVKVNGVNVTSSVSDNQYTIDNIRANTTLEVEFEAISPTTYSLTIKATGNGVAVYNGTTIRSKSTTFYVYEGNSATITFTPDAGYKIKNVNVNGANVTSSVLGNQYTISNINSDISVEVEFEAIPPITYSLTIRAAGNGSASYNGTTISNNNTTFTVIEGTSAIITFAPDNGYRIMSVKVNGTIVASDVSAYQYTVSNINSDTTVEVEFMEQLMAFSSNGVNYSVASYDDRTVTVGSGNYGKALEVPANVSYQEKTWKVTGIDNAAIADNARLAAVIWNAETRFTPNVSNPNFLLYVKSADYAPSTVKNVVVNGTAKAITLTDATNGNDFYCPQEFTAQRISYTHNYMMTTGIGESRGWETIALPFDVQQVTHQSGGELVPFAKWQSGNEGKPFWLMELGSSGWTEATAIKANTPYIISMPNNENYKPEFRVNGNVTFKAENVTVRRSDEVESGKGNGKTFVPNFTNQESAGYYALNVSNDYVTYSGGAAEGSRFVAGLRPVRPFEAYMTSEAGVREIAIADDLATGIEQAIVLIGGRGDTKVYDLKGRVVADGAGCSQEELRRMLPYGVYIFNGRKLIVK
jgi:carbon monoxide dehydrogenase subunit G